MVNERITEKAIELLCRLIEVPRVSREETAAADLLQAYMQGELGLEVQREGNNLWSIAPDFDDKKQTLLLNAHIDTVKPVAGWQRDPFKATREGSRIYGLGSNDDGASLVSLLHVFAELAKHSPKEGAGRGLYNLVFLASAEEEVSGKNGIESVLPSIQKMVNDKLSNGKDDIQWFCQHQWEKVSPLLGPVKMSVTVVNAGTQHNVVPDVCSFTVDVRSNECYTNRELYDLICQHVKSDVKARSFRLGSSSIDANHPLVQRIVALGGKPFGSPTLSDQALMPFPSLKMGPGESSRSHSADEFVDVDEISQAIETYMKVLSC